MARFYQDFYVADSAGKFLEQATNAYLTLEEGRAQLRYQLWNRWAQKGYKGHVACSVWKGKNTVECFDGKSFSQHVGTSNKATVTCPPGQVWNGTKCVYAKKLSKLPSIPVVAGVGVPSPYAHMTPVASNTVRWLGEPVSNVAAYKLKLIAWSKTKNGPLTNYGLVPEDLLPTWNCMRDGVTLAAFSKWWNTSYGNNISLGSTPTSGTCKGVLVAELDTEHATALDAWAGGSTKMPPSGGGAWPGTCPAGTKLVNGICVPDVFTGCPPGQFKNPMTGQCVTIPVMPPLFTQPTAPMPSSAPAEAVACLASCEQKYGATSPGGLQPVAFAVCVSACGGQVPAGGSKDPGVVECDGKTPCPAGKTCVNGKCQPNLPPPPPPKTGTTTAPSSSNVGIWVAGAAAAAGVLYMIFGRSSKLLMNSVQPFRGSDVVVIEKRKSDGSLDFSAPQPPKDHAKFDEVYRWMFRSDPNAEGSWEHLSRWLKRRGWVLRKKTW